jgi:hypothetical protein
MDFGTETARHGGRPGRHGGRPGEKHFEEAVRDVKQLESTRRASKVGGTREAAQAMSEAERLVVRELIFWHSSRRPRRLYGASS